METIQEMTGCTREQAEEALRKYGDEIWLAVDSLLKKPEVAGDKYAPPKPTIDTGLSPEQADMCRRGRELQDKVNGVFSVAHSKTQTQLVQPEDEGQSTPHSSECSCRSAGTASPSELTPDSDAKTTQ